MSDKLKKQIIAENAIICLFKINLYKYNASNINEIIPLLIAISIVIKDSLFFLDLTFTFSNNITPYIFGVLSMI